MAILISLGGYLYLYHPTPIPLKMDLRALPSTIGDWRWTRTENTRGSFGVQGTDDGVMNIYKNGAGREIKIYIGYFESQRGDKGVTHYRSAWLHKKAEQVELHTNPRGDIRINKTIFQDRMDNQLLLFWYDMNGKIVSSRYKAKIFNAINGLFRGRTNGAIIIVSKNFEGADNPKEILKDELEFVRELLPVLQRYLPSS